MGSNVLIKFGWDPMIIIGEVAWKIVESEILQSALNDPKPNSKNWASKLPYIYVL